MKTSGIILLSVLALVAGCGRVKDTASRASNKAGQLVGEGASSFFTGVGEGIDKTVTTYDFQLSEELKSAGVSTTIAKRMDGCETNGWRQILSVYVQNQTPVTGTLRIRLFNDKDQEIGRSVTPVALPKDDARYISFSLEKKIPVTMTKYVKMDLKKD